MGAGPSTYVRKGGHRVKSYPSEIITTVAERGLGEVTARHRLAVSIEVSFAVTCGALCLFGLLFGDDVGRGIGAGAGVLAVLFAVPAWRKAHRYLYLCSGGLLTATGTAVTRLVHWDEVAHVRVWTTRVYQLGPYEEFSRCVLELTDGTTLNLHRPPYADLDKLGAAVERLVAQTSYPRRLAEIADHGATGFGPITVTAGGVRDGDRFAAWSDITGLERGRVRLRVYGRSGQPVVSRQVRTIPDVAVLVALVSEGAARTG